MEDTASRYGGQLRMYYYISGCGQPIRDGPPDWGLGEGLTTHSRKKKSLLRSTTQGLEKRVLVTRVINLQIPLKTENLPS
jgi:hypothetical protein